MFYFFKNKKVLFLLFIYILICFFIYTTPVSAKELYNFSGSYIYYSPQFTQPLKKDNSFTFNNSRGAFSSTGYLTNSTYDEYPFLSNNVRDYQTNVQDSDYDFTYPHLTKQFFYLYLDDFTEDDYNEIINSSKTYYLFALIRSKYYYDITNPKYFTMTGDYNGTSPDFYLENSRKNYYFSVSNTKMLSKEFDNNIESEITVYNEFLNLQLSFKYENLSSFPIEYDTSKKMYFIKFIIDYNVQDYVSSLDTLNSYAYIPEFEERVSTFQFDKFFISDDIKDLSLVQFDNYSNPDSDVFYTEGEVKYPTEQDSNQAEPDNRTIWEKVFDFLWNFVLKIVNFLFVPKSSFYFDKLHQMQDLFITKFGVLTVPIEVLKSILNAFSELSVTPNSYIITVPDYTIPGFNTPILHKQSYDLMNVLNIPEIHNLWILYLDFVDVFLIVAFLNLAYNKLMSFVGGITTEVDSVTVDDYDTFDRSTGEQISSRRVVSTKNTERRTRRKL